MGPPLAAPIAIHEKLMAVRLNCSFSMARHVKDAAITQEVQAAHGSTELEARKNRFPQDSGTYLKALQATLAEFYGYHIKVTMSSLNDGERLLPVPFYLDYMQEYGVYDVMVHEKFDDFKAQYPNSVARAAQILGPAFNPADYPDVSELDKYLKYKVITLPLPQADTLLSVIGASVQSDVDTYIGEAMAQGLADINIRIKKAVTRMVEQLSNPKGKVYDTLTGSLLELMSYVPSFNVTADDSLSLLCEEVKSKLLVHNTELLRSDPVVRQNVAAEAADILRRMG